MQKMSLDYQTIFKELNEGNIDYLLVGGLAVNFYGIPRMTYDLDVMIDLNPENVLRIVYRLGRWGYKPRVPVKPEDLADEAKRRSWVLEKNMKAFSFYNDIEAIGEIDLIIDAPIPYKELKERAEVFEIEGIQVPVVSISDLIGLKTRAGRKQDLSDAEHLKRTLVEP